MKGEEIIYVKSLRDKVRAIYVLYRIIKNCEVKK